MPVTEFRVFLSKPDIRGGEVEALTRVIESGWVAPAGPAIATFESEVAARADREFAVGLTSGTAALQLALLSLGVPAGGEVACPTLTFVATANAIVHAGAVPVFIDSDRGSWNIDPELLTAELAERDAAGNQFAAVMTVDLYGQCADYTKIVDACARYGVPLVEDSAEALGATCGGRPAGSFGEASVFSFNGNKIITSAGGGMLLTNNGDIAERVTHLATQAKLDVPHYEHDEVGFNFRMSNVLAALGSAQLATLDERIARRREINATYRELLEPLDYVEFMPEADFGTSTSWLTCLTVDPDSAPLAALKLVLALHDRGIESRPVWKPMHLQPIFADAASVGGEVAADLFHNGLCLPSGSGMTDDELNLVCESLTSILDL